jgi:ppGpp synthetase/RelA/SpoT-type nucleotidyltranferase
MNPKYITENNKIKESIIDILNSNSIEFFIQNRVKSTNSYEKKLRRKQDDKYFNEITDISGIRIILNKVSDMRRCIGLIMNSFNIDYQNSNFNSLSFIDPNEFGYSSSHIIIDNNRIKTELQIRTLSQHIWAITSHNLSYKSQSKDSLFERKLFRLSGLLEQVDVLIEELYESKPTNTGINYDTLKILDHYSLEYFLSREERVFSLINICFERKRNLTGDQKHPFSMKLLDGSKAYHNNNKSSMNLILIACNHLKINSPQKLKDYLIDKKSNAKLIKKKFTNSNFLSETISPALRLFLFLINDIPFDVLKVDIENFVHPIFLENIKDYLEN